jgi:hypothetical protein
MHHSVSQKHVLDSTKVITVKNIVIVWKVNNSKNVKESVMSHSFAAKK